MVQAMILFNQLLQHFPILEFAALVEKHSAERAAKGFSCRTQLVAMLFCQMAHADSLREICNGLACCLGKLVHLGIKRGAQQIDAGIRQPASACERCMKTCFIRLSGGSATRRAGAAQAEVPFQKQAAVAGFDHHQSVSGDVSVGQIPAGQGRRQGPRPARP